MLSPKQFHTPPLNAQESSRKKRKKECNRHKWDDYKERVFYEENRVVAHMSSNNSDRICKDCINSGQTNSTLECGRRHKVLPLFKKLLAIDSCLNRKSPFFRGIISVGWLPFRPYIQECIETLNCIWWV